MHYHNNQCTDSLEPAILSAQFIMASSYAACSTTCTLSLLSVAHAVVGILAQFTIKCSEMLSSLVFDQMTMPVTT